MMAKRWNKLIDLAFDGLEWLYSRAEHILGQLTCCDDCGKLWGWGNHDDCEF